MFNIFVFVFADILWSSTVSEKTTNNLVDPIIIAVVCVIVLLISIIIIAAILKRKKAFTTQRFSIIQESTERTPVSFGGLCVILLTTILSASSP
jgi:Na+/H+ antiporter NhaD/arsenite permease-like protein